MPAQLAPVLTVLRPVADMCEMARMLLPGSTDPPSTIGRLTLCICKLRKSSMVTAMVASGILNWLLARSNAADA